MSRSDSSTSSSSSSACASLVRAGRRGPAPASSARANGSRQRPHCRPSAGLEAAPQVDGLVFALARCGPGRRPPSRAKLSSPSRWTSPGSRARRSACPSGGILETCDDEHVRRGAQTARFYAFRLDCQGLPTAVELAQERGAGGQGRQPEVLGEGRPRGRRRCRARPGPPPAAPAAPRTSRGTFSRVWSVETSDGIAAVVGGQDEDVVLAHAPRAPPAGARPAAPGCAA